ncbi:MAG TPA: ABC transporter permease [Puia sp.]|jgi:ABC-type antimicrobial peptide transport system permease subunit
MKPAYYFITAWRNLIRRKTANFLNILGLGVGLAGCLVIFLILQHEFSYDRYHKNSSRIYELVKDLKTDHGVDHERSVPFEAISELRNDYPQVRWAELFTSYGSQVTVMKDAATTGNDKFIEERGLLYAEPELFDLFDVKWLNGNAAVLRENNTVVLSQSVAARYFGQWQRAIGQYIRVDNVITAKVSGIIADPPTNTDFPFTVVLSYRTFLANTRVWGFNDLRGWGWGVSDHQIYARLPEQVTASAIDKSLPAFVTKYSKMDRMDKVTYFLHPLREIHFDTRFGNNGDHASSKTSLYTLGFIGLLILLMACINFVNLSTALAATRSKEIGVRKIMGSSRIQLAWQVLTDTALVVLLSMSLALLLAQLSLPYIRYISPIEEPLDLLNAGTLYFFGGALVVATLLSGFYPALQLSRLNPIEAIRSTISASLFGGLSLRRVLVVLQFSFSQLLIIATLIAVSQMNFIRDADLGFTKEAVLQLAGNSDSAFRAREKAFKQELLTLKDVQSVSFSHDAPSSGNNWESNFGFDHVEADKPFSAYLKFADMDYANTYDLKMAAGHWYTTNDTLGEVVINETMAHKLGINDPQRAIGKDIRIGGGPNGKWTSIAGVVKDFKNTSLKQGVPPNIILRNRRLSSFAGVRFKSNNLGRSSRAVETVWNKYYPEYAFNSSFMDDNINKFYRQEQRLSLSYKVYTILAILISSLGLYGLVSFMAVQKTKEVGIRKVLGASVAHIVYLFSREFTVLITLAFIISAPIAYYMMHNWLQDFVYRIHIGAGVFIFAIMISIGIAWMTVGYKSVRAALENPAKSLKSE